MKAILVKNAHWLVLGIAAIWTVLEVMPPSAKTGDIDLNLVASLPVESDGRVKPLDTLARTSLLAISNDSEFRDENDHKQPAIRWLMDVFAANGDPINTAAAKYRVFRIESDQVLDLLGLPKRPGVYRYSYAEIHPSFEKLQEAYTRASKNMESKKTKDLFEVKIVELADRVARYRTLVQRLAPRVVPPRTDGGEWLSLNQVREAVVSNVLTGRADEILKMAREDLSTEAARRGLDLTKLEPDAVEDLVRRRAFRIVEAVTDRAIGEIYPAAADFEAIVAAYRAGDGKAFREAVATYRGKDFAHMPERTVNRSDFEAFLNRVQPFKLAGWMYVCGFVLAALSWLYWPETLRKAAFWLCLLTLVLHTAALVGRMYLMGREMVFVTNLYSSAVFIGWGCVGVGLILEAIYRNGIGAAIGAVLGAVSNLIGHYILADSDTLAPLEPVLDTTFWLSTHVTMVTMGYVATLLTGGLGAAYLITGVFTPYLDRSLARTLSGMLYGVLCFATLMSFTGTVLGGIWADQSWGRFWGWDPKENGAVLVVIWNALILHARWGGMVKRRGIAVLSLVGVIITFWSWFGTNQLGVGLHAYGFSNKLVNLCLIAWSSMIILIGVGLIPQRYWKSSRAQVVPPPSVAAGPKARKVFPHASS
jgi:ABC-type transport system involved in cytochrome c biogenesis permease subunit